MLLIYWMHLLQEVEICLICNFFVRFIFFIRWVGFSVSKNRILVIGSTGQIGSDLLPELIDLYGQDNVVAGVFNSELSEGLKNLIPTAYIDVTKYHQIEKTILENKINIVSRWFDESCLRSLSCL